MADGKLPGRNDPFRLEADVEQNLVLVDLYNGAFDNVAVVELDDRPRDGVL